MSAPTSDIIQVTVVSSPAGVQQPSFNVELFLATHKYYTDRIRAYSRAADLVTDGFLTTDPAYLAAVAYFSQQPAPSTLKVGRRSVDVVDVDITAAATTVYSVTINGVAYTYDSTGGATQDDIGAGLVSAIGSNVAGVTPTYTGGVLTLTGTTDLAWNLGACTPTAKLAIVAFVASATDSHDLDAVTNVDPNFYGVSSQDRDSTSQQALATWCAANVRLAFLQSQEANVIAVAPGSDSSTLPVIEKAASQKRATVTYGAGANADFRDVALAGRMFALPPGGATAFLKDLVGITPDNLTTTNRQNAHGKNCNVYELQGDGLPGVTLGVVSSGLFIDQVIGRDWFTSVLSLNVLAALRAPTKVDFTDAGIAIVGNAINNAIATAVQQGYIAKGTAVLILPKAAAVSPTDKANRQLTGVTLNYTEAGAVQGVAMEIFVAV